MDRLTFLRTSPREIDGILEQIAVRERRMFVPAALICATICNVNRDPDSRPEPFTVADFLPGEESEEEISDKEFMEKVMRGESFEVDPEAALNFRKQMEAAFRNIGPAVTTTGPKGKELARP